MGSEHEAIELRVRPPRIPPTITSLTLSLVVLALTCGIAWFLYAEARETLIFEIKRSLQRTAALAADRLDAQMHTRLIGMRKDTPEYAAQNAIMLQTAKADPEIAYAYTAIEKDGAIWLVLDTEPPDSEEDDEMQALQPYEDAPQALLDALAGRRAGISEPYSDQWGTFITAYAPFHDAAGNFGGVVGIDLALSDYEQRLKPMGRAALATYIAGTVISVLIGLVLWWTYRRSSAMEQLGRQLSNVNALLNVSKALGSNVGIDNLLPTIVASTSQVMRAERSSLFLYDRSKRLLIGRVTEGMQAGHEFVIPDDRGIAGRVARTGQLANIKDPRSDPDFDDSFDRQSGFSTRAILTVPVLDARNQVVGVLQALNPVDNHPFDSDDETMMAALAGQAAIALERERLNQSAAEKRKLEDALKFAQSIQLGMLPQNYPDPASSGVEVHATLIPAKIVGGDFYDFVWIDFDLLGLVIADVSGKGIPAALLMAKAMTLIRAHLAALQNPAEALRKANDELAHDNDQAMFVTVFVAMYDCRNRTLTYSNGGHNAPLLVREGKAQEIEGALSVPLGVQEDSDFELAQIELQDGDVLYLFTDGVSEAMDPDNALYGDERLHRNLATHSSGSMRELIEGSIGEVREFTRGADQSDDITVLAMKVWPRAEGAN